MISINRRLNHDNRDKGNQNSAPGFIARHAPRLPVLRTGGSQIHGWAGNMAVDEIAERKRANAMMTTTMGEIVSRPLTKTEIRSSKLSREEFRKIKKSPIYLVLDSLMCAHNVGTTHQAVRCASG